MEASTTTTRPVPREHTLVHFEIPASDPAKISNFYNQLFGWKFNKYEGAGMDYWLISHKEATSPDDTLGGLFKRNTPTEGFVNYFSTRNIDESLRKAEALGAKVAMPKQEIPQVGWFAVLHDPDGNVFALFQGRM